MQMMREKPYNYNDCIFNESEIECRALTRKQCNKRNATCKFYKSKDNYILNADGIPYTVREYMDALTKGGQL